MPPSVKLVSCDNTIIFIGPEGSGKSTIGKLVAPLLGKDLFTLDRHRDRLYAPYDYDKVKAGQIYDKEGVWAFYRYWKTFEFQAVSHILRNASKPGDEYFGKILDFGAGHSVYEDPKELETIAELMASFTKVVLFMPCPDIDRALEICEQRRGHALELNRHFMEHESNSLLAKCTVYTQATTPERCAEKVLYLIRNSI